MSTSSMQVLALASFDDYNLISSKAMLPTAMLEYYHLRRWGALSNQCLGRRILGICPRRTHRRDTLHHITAKRDATPSHPRQWEL